MTTWMTPTQQRARKTHQCIFCTRRIDPGETYTRGCGIDGGDIWTWKTCDHCREIVALYDLHRFAMDEGLTYDDLEDWEPRSVTEARHIVQWRRGWRRNDGQLYPTPKETPCP